MNKKHKEKSTLAILLPVCCLFAILTLTPASSYANSAPVISDVSASQRSDASKLIDIYYNLTDADGDTCTVWAAISDNNGVSWNVPANDLTGHIGQAITPGSGKHIVWDAGADCPGKTGSFKTRIWADDGNGDEAMVFVPGGWFGYQEADEDNYVLVESFMMAKYETTVAQYCKFLNATSSTNDPNASGSNYYGSPQEIIQKGEAGSYYYEVQQNRGNYPVRYVSLDDAEAYCSWLSSNDANSNSTYRLPTEQEWEKAAGWDPARQKLWNYAFQQDNISPDWCNYNNYYGDLLEVGSFNGSGNKKDAYSCYRCYDMTGNVMEWTSSGPGENRVARGGYWYSLAQHCNVTYRYCYYPTYYRYLNLGFRVVQEIK